MVKYSKEPEAGASIKTAKARASDLRTSFKNMRETAMAVKNMPLNKARAYLNRVLEHKDVVPLRRFNGSAGRTPLTKQHGFSGPGRFPEKSVKHLLDLRACPGARVAQIRRRGRRRASVERRMRIAGWKQERRHAARQASSRISTGFARHAGDSSPTSALTSTPSYVSCV